MESVLIVKQGDSDVFEETVSNMDTLAGYTVKMYIDGEDSITGSVSDLVISYILTREACKELTSGKHDYETKAFDASHHNHTLSKGILIIEPVEENDPS